MCNYIDIEKLVVPVLRNADGFSMLLTNTMYNIAGILLAEG